jgi:sugar-specific transcriptional regulator TrmB
VKLVELARHSVAILKERGEEGIRSDELAEILGVPKRRVYDVIAVLRSLDQVETKRRFNGTTVTWIDKSKNFVARSEYDSLKSRFNEESLERRELQTQLAETKEQLRITRSKLRLDVQAVESADKTEFNTTQLRIRALSSRGFKRVTDSGLEAIVETYEPGIVVDPSEVEVDENEAILKNLQKL